MVDVVDTKTKSSDLEKLVDVYDSKDNAIDLEELVKLENFKGENLNHGVSVMETNKPLTVPVVVEKKRKVGRPRKQKVEITKTEVHTQRRRGRPRKVKLDGNKPAESQKVVRESERLKEKKKKLEVKFEYKPENGEKSIEGNLRKQSNR